MTTVKVSIAKDFSEFPAGRIPEDGPFPGSTFRDTMLVPRLQREDNVVEVDLDGTMGYGSSFLEEAFGGLVRNSKLRKSFLEKHLKIKDSRQIYEPMVWSYIADEDRRVFGG